jgi:hypothetical protein
MPRLPPPVITRILQHLPTASIFTASLVCSSWRKLLFTSGPPSQALLKPHLAVLRHHFGEARVPHKISIAALRKLLVLYARQELFGEFSSTASYNLSSLQLSKFALSASLLAIARNGKILLFDLQQHPLRLLACIKAPNKRIVALALSEVFLAVLDEAGKVHLYHLLARDTPNFLPLHTFSVAVPALRDPAAIAITQEGGAPPLIAVLGGEQLHLLHPAHALSEKRRQFFRDAADEKGGSAEKAPATSHEWILTATTAAGFAAPLAFGMYGRHLSDGTAYLGSAWSNESSAELARRRIYGLKDGQDIATRPHDADALFRHYRGGGKWGAPKRLDTGEVEVKDAMHLWDAFYIVTETATGLVRIVSVAPFEHLCLLYRRGERGGRNHCGYAVWAGLVEGKRAPGSYVAFSPAEGRLKILPLHRVPWARKPPGEDAGWELVRMCRDIAIGSGEILGMVAGPKRVLVVFEDRVVVVRLWTQKVGGVEDEEGGAWAVGKGGAVHRDGKVGRTNCMGLDKGECAVM